MSLRGPLHGQKQYLTKMLENYDITLQAVRFSETIGKKTTVYRFIYDVRSKLEKIVGSDGETEWKDPRPFRESCQHDLLKNVLEEHIDGYEVSIELPDTLKSPPDQGFRWRVLARVHFTKKTKSKAKKKP